MWYRDSYHCPKTFDEYIERVTSAACLPAGKAREIQREHQWCYERGVKDTSRGGTYHNKRFKAEAERRGLLIGYDSRIGWSVTKPGPALIAMAEQGAFDACERELHRIGGGGLVAHSAHRRREGVGLLDGVELADLARGLRRTLRLLRRGLHRARLVHLVFHVIPPHRHVHGRRARCGRGSAMRFTVFHVYRSPFLLSGARSISGALVGVVALTCLPPVPPDFFLRTTSDASSASARTPWRRPCKAPV